ncbi:MAG: 2Fe-2S iron-sulfur cluster binding domain-containing protein [Polaromonas sp.]|nr:2Fe-2S iron-sulfur cluster binding domain-containing protein [Polaromonas sp.]
MTNTTTSTARVANTSLQFSAPADIPLLQAAELAGVPDLKMNSSCRNGTCRTCICQLLEREVTYRIECPGLSLIEKREGWILPCVGYPVSNLVFELPA